MHDYMLSPGGSSVCECAKSVNKKKALCIKNGHERFVIFIANVYLMPMVVGRCVNARTSFAP